ncbi:Purple acid Phosphatase, N-terminal domain [Mariniphaga anaerophila]|uniref:Purple acid Phosphatase, N-terminal domain n=1 Tax=Mariniphaga anaerophila TaxID=1484053 RepID=A0A1M4VRR0_9BACT|nr:metallophosphoesterase family protein [Mariniphaga anaerophila]SHE71801.1 Purple acid Phosphatase, N-terminal domain [Mariniphaga anaerophila]
MKLQSILASLLLSLCFNVSMAQHKSIVYKTPKYEKEWMQPTVHPDRIILNYGADPRTTASVTWRTSADVKTAYAEIAKATAAPKFWRTSERFAANTELLDGSKVKDAGIVANYHSVTFKNLEPNTLYGYRVGDGEHWSEWIQFKTASDSNDKFSFLYVGDAQNYILELWSRLIRQGFLQAPNARFIVHAGDLVSTAHSEQQWEEWFKAGSFIHGMIASFPVPGNHEYEPLYEGQDDDLEKLSIQWRPQFTLPENGLNNIDELKETVYYMDFQGVRMIGLNSSEHREEQAEWLEKVLADNPNQWTVVTFHHPLYSASEGRDNKSWRELLKPIFDKYHVDLVLQGHDHTYARGRVSPKEYNLTSGVNKRDQTGTVYVVSVSGGKMYRLRKNGWKNWGAEQNRDGENTQLVQVVTVNKDTIHYKSYTATGDLYDAFNLIKNKKGPNTFVDLKDEAIAARYHNNTISYFDELPLDIKKKVLEKYPGFKIDKVSIREGKDASIYYDVDLEKGDEEYELKIDEQGVIFSEEKDN